ncbi:uncharacterized protein LOC114525992 isoform X2 [Dendronephthya gigantea]|uniref:uncharacterized protein LOC114525992 isoform X2 n=1 Tax=Dendronephthya gigantea TaxID=151771 RepID=UPI00106B19B3|nr:uncharacterized protein LOC114525992 isoform X2 [Dendronephthya gigantea]
MMPEGEKIGTPHGDHLAEKKVETTLPVTMGGKVGMLQTCGGDDLKLEKEKTARLKYSYKGNMFSRMLVEYEVNGKNKDDEVRGSGSSILIPENATNIQVRFQLFSSFGTWSDLMTYEPTKPRILKYDKPVIHTYILCADETDSLFPDEAGSGSLVSVSKAEWFETNILDDNRKMKEKYTKGLSRLKWVESFKITDVNEKRYKHLEIVLNFDEVPSTEDIVELFGEEILPFITYKKFPKNEWFETNIFDEKSNMKKEYKEKLLSLPGVEKIHVGFDGKKDGTWKIFITHSENSQPSMDQLRMIFGNNISCFVEFIQEKVDKNSRSAFLRGPRTGDPHHVTGEENGSRGKISILGFGDKHKQKHHAITSYHVCYQGELSGDLFEQHQKLKAASRNNFSECSNGEYKYKDGSGASWRLGTFSCGLYNGKHDIALIELDKYLDCNDAVRFMNQQDFDDALASEKEVAEKFKKMNGTVPVGIFGSETGERIGNLVEKDVALKKGMNDGFYGIKDVSDDNIFAEEADSGSLVYMICEDGKKIPFAHLSNMKNGVYYCSNLKSSLEALASSVNPCLCRCGNHFE